MDNAIPALVIGAIMLVASSLMARGSLHTYDQLSSSVKQMEARLGEQSRTRLSISNAAFDVGAGVLTFELYNEGQTRITDYTRLDLLLSFFSSPGVRETAWLPYTPETEPGAWTVVSILDDIHEPGILNPGETAQISVELPGAIEAGQTNLIVIATERGSSTTYPFGS